jgi:hypothetical protein
VAKTAPARVYPAPLVLNLGPWTGVTDSPVPPAGEKDRLYQALNLYVSTGTTGKVVKGRPGFVIMDEALSGTPDFQWIGQFTEIDGTERTVGIAGGEIYTYDHGTDAWTKVVETADLTTASITCSATARCYCVTFANTLVISDGANVPFTWDGTTGAGGLVELTNAPVTYGQPVVYYSKLFLIKNAERDTIVWSEELQANTGYEAGGYNNAWTLGGTKGEVIVALAARNDSLGIIRPRSTTTIIGAVNDDFQTTGTRSSVSENIGTSSPGGVLVLDEGTVILDSDGKPQFWPNGAGYAERPSMWEDCEALVETVPHASFTKSQIVYDTHTNVIIIGIGDTVNTSQVQYLIFERTGGVPNYVGTWNGFTSHVMGIVKDSDLRPRWVHGTDAGTAFIHGTPGDGPWTDNGTAIHHTLTAQAAGYDLDEECRFDEITVGFWESDNTTVSFDYETSRGVSSGAQSVTLTATGTGLYWDVDDWDEANWAASGSGEQRKRVGIKGYGRWIRPRVLHDESGDRIGFTKMRVTAFRDGRWPAVP